MEKTEAMKKLTLEEKAGFTTGRDNWSTKELPSYGIRSVRVSDGPNGLASPKDSQAAVNAEEFQAVCFPTACATASSFDTKLLWKIGEELGEECKAVGVDMLLGPGINIKRSPLCGRNFEYFSEDPFLSGEMGAAFVKGLQSKGVGACVKHFCANSQEYRRNDSSSEVDERTLREIYLPAFEKAVKEAKPAAIMAAYNKVNGTYATEHKELLEDILRTEWGFEGAVVSDWGAVHDRVAAIKAGCDITMPSDSGHDGQVIQAVLDGTLAEEDLDRCVERVLALAKQEKQSAGQIDFERGHSLAKRAEEESCVLLKNEGLLPLKKEMKAAFIGAFARNPHYQGSGSSSVNCQKPLGAYEAALLKNYPVSYAAGYQSIVTEDALLKEAAAAAGEADVAVLFVGLLPVMESEGNDRHSLCMPESHCTLIHEVCKANPNTVVVLHNGGPVEMPWIEEPKAVLETYLGGEAVGEAVLDILYGDVNPSGHLAETFPKKLSDASSYLFYFGEGDKVSYTERFFVGYRYSCTKETEPLFPFGYGLSYTTFAYTDLRLDREECLDTDTVRATVTVRNTGNRDGKAVVQLYVAPPREEVIRPMRELKGFQKIFLKAGEEREVSFTLSDRAFAHWSEDFHDWRIEDGTYWIQICEHAHKVAVEKCLHMKATKPIRRMNYHISMPLKDFMKTEEGLTFIEENIAMVVYGLAHQGFLSEKLLDRIREAGDGVITVRAVRETACDRKLCSNEVYDLSNLFEITLETFQYFIPEEQRQVLGELLQQGMTDD